jgi:Ca2+-binding RTX toxin-like protein/subtilisin-like proprotein convertase family protein
MPLPTDPLLASQWHLGNTGGLLDLNVRAVWNPAQGAAYTGAGTRVVVIDDGFDYNHSDLAPNYDTFLDFDWDSLDNGSNGDHDFDPFGNPGDAHGTAVTGIIGADDNGTGAVGVAFDTSIVGYRTYGFISDGWLQDIRDSIHHAAVSAQGDVANISQGIANDFGSEFGNGYNAARFDEIETSINTAVDSGRGGLGMTIVKSAGNSRAGDYDVNADDWTNDTRQVVVAAVDQNGFVSSYSSYGAAILVSGFGTPGEVVTTDRVGGDGYDLDDFTETFNGTSSAAPMVSGVTLLMYDANASLGWRDVQSILANSARQVGSEVGAGTAGFERYAWDWNAAGTWNGGGLHFSNDYGYGLVDALAAVRLAETWLLTESAQTSANEFTNTVDMLNSAVVIPDGNAAGTTFTGNAGFDDEVERVTVQMTFSTTFTGDMEVYVTSPDGTVSELIRQNGDTTDFNGTWTFESQAFRGERAAGSWSVRVVDAFGGDVLTVSDIVLTTWGRFSVNDRYVYTNEYADYAGIGGHSTALSDANGGTDTINAAAVSSNSIINLNSGAAGSIAGQAFGVAAGTTIENAIGGDGNDQLIGNSVANRLFGMRGNDSLSGNDGNDTLEGRDGNDVVRGGDGIDSHLGGAGDDTIYLDPDADNDTVDGGLGSADILNLFYATSGITANFTSIGGGTVTGGGLGTDTFAGIEQLYGSAFNDSVTGSDGGEYFYLREGNDSAGGGGGGDTIYGVAGNDTLRDGWGVDLLSGDADNDTLYADADLWSGDSFRGGAGTGDILSLFYATGGVTLNFTGTGVGTFSGGGLGADGFTGIETVYGSLFADNMTGSSGNEYFYLRDGADVANGGSGNDTIDGVAGNDNLSGASGNDTLNGGDDNDTLNGGNDDDTLNGGNHNDTLNGSFGNDSLNGNAGDDTLNGFDGNDVLNGGSGLDLLRGGLGVDQMNGAADADVFDFDALAESGLIAGSRDIITGFAIGVDDIDLSSIDAKAGTAGNNAFAFIGAAAFSAEGQIRAVQSGANTILEINTAGLLGAEMTIQLNAFTAATLTSGDFVL